jgi:biopolymer transport protein TolR
MTPYRIKRHRKRSHAGAGGHMTLVPFIDMLTILVVFLLVHTSDVDVLPNTKNIAIPESVADKKPKPTVVVMITKDDLLVDGRSVARISTILGSDDTVIQPLKTALQAQTDRILAEAAKQDVANREVTILGDRATPYSVLRKVMATCTDAEYGKVSLAVIQRDRAPVAQARTASLVEA